MKDIIIKYSLLTLLVILTGVFVYSNPRAKTFEEDALIFRPSSESENQGANALPKQQDRPKKKKKITKVKLEKNEDGIYKAKWGLLAEYDLKEKKAGMNLKKLINKKVVISGFMMPLDYSAKNIKEFLLVPYVPSCSHVPPPPNNQIISVKVTGKEGTKPLYAPVKMQGVLKLSKSKKSKDPYMPSGVFEMSVKKIEKVKRRQ